MIALAFALLTLGNPLAPHGLGVENTYTITSVMDVLPPADPAVMTDAYQDTVVIGRKGDLIRVSVTYFPMDDAVRQQRLRRYASQPSDLSRYLASTTTCNWDADTHNELVAELRRAGIAPSAAPTANYVQRVAAWAMESSRFDGNPSAMPPDWFVSFKNHRPSVAPELRHDFDTAKGKGVSDAAVFAHQLFGKQMIAGHCHGACTSSAIYLATIFRALGVPARILYFIPPCDGNDDSQVSMLRKAITNHRLNDVVISGASGATGFANHMFDEVWVEGRWRRLSYDRMDQEIADRNYLGLLTHIATYADIEESHLAETWGKRSTEWPNVTPKLSSVNPYRLVAVCDHWGSNASGDNPETPRLKTGTVVKVAWKGTADFNAMLFDHAPPKDLDLMLFTKEWIPSRDYMQMREFMSGASRTMELRAPGQPAIQLEYSDWNFNTSTDRSYGFHVLGADRAKLRHDITYRLVPIQASTVNRWIIPEDLIVRYP